MWWTRKKKKLGEACAPRSEKVKEPFGQLRRSRNARCSCSPAMSETESQPPRSRLSAEVPAAVPRRQDDPRRAWADVVMALARRLVELEDHLSDMVVVQRNVKNDLLTLVDENLHLQMALDKERFKAERAWAVLEGDTSTPDAWPASSYWTPPHDPSASMVDALPPFIPWSPDTLNNMLMANENNDNNPFDQDLLQK